MTVLAPDEAYRRWAPTYEPENAFSAIECDVVSRLSPPPRGLRLLDVGCGTGRRLVDSGAASAVGIDPCAEMLAAGSRVHAFGPEVRTLLGDARALPLPDAAFDLVWCRLMIGHVSDCRAVYRELGRVSARGGRVVVTDFHPAAWQAGFRRTFRDGGELLEVEHHLHTAEEQVAAAADAGLLPAATADGIIGSSVLAHFESAGKTEAYREYCGRSVVLGLAFVRDA